MSREDEVIDEILGGVDHWEHGESPDGPWSFRSLRVKRSGNVIGVIDVDGREVDVFYVDEVGSEDDPHRRLLRRLRRLDEISINQQ